MNYKAEAYELQSRIDKVNACITARLFGGSIALSEGRKTISLKSVLKDLSELQQILNGHKK